MLFDREFKFVVVMREVLFIVVIIVIRLLLLYVLLSYCALSKQKSSNRMYIY